MKLVYFSNKIFPAKSANTIQIISMCEAFRNKEVSHFIELDKNGEIVRIV